MPKAHAIDDNVPEFLLCPLSRDVMEDPVRAPDGFVYERALITEWLERNRSSPLTRQHMDAQNLVKDVDVLMEAKRYKKWAAGDRSSPFTLKDGTLAIGQHQGNLGVARNGFEVAFTKSIHNGKLLLSVEPVQSETREPQDICALVDISGSMGSRTKPPEGQQEVIFTKLDVVKHALKTIVESLHEDDGFTLVLFDDDTRVEVPYVNMRTPDDKAKVLSIVDKMSTGGCTDIWNALQTALAVMDARPSKRNLASIFLLSDGDSTSGSTEEDRELAEYLSAVARGQKGDEVHPPAVHTFAFGYDVNAAKMSAIARNGCGTFNFISDVTMVGTVMSHALSYNLLQVASHVNIVVENVPMVNRPEDGLDKSLLDLPYVKHSDCEDGFALFSIPSICIGHKLDFVLPIQPGSNPMDGKVTVTYKASNGDSVVRRESTLSMMDIPSMDVYRGEREVTYEDTRLKACLLLLQPTEADDLVKARPMLERFIETELLASLKACGNDSRLLDLSKDLKGELTMALDDANYKNWGRLFIYSYREALLGQRRNNFKDKAISRFGGIAFQRVRDHVREKFASIPPPKSSYHGGYGGGGRMSSMISSMALFDDPRGACFTGDSLATLADGSVAPVAALKKGDEVATMQGESDTIECVVVTRMASSSRKMVKLNRSLTLTPFHPVYVGGRWQFPAYVDEGEESESEVEGLEKGKMEVDFVFSFVLSSRKIMHVGGLPVATFGHGLEEEVIQHPYFGSEQVISDLKSLPGYYAEGMVYLEEDSFVRDESSHLICGLKQGSSCSSVTRGEAAAEETNSVHI